VKGGHPLFGNCISCLKSGRIGYRCNECKENFNVLSDEYGRYYNPTFLARIVGKGRQDNDPLLLPQVSMPIGFAYDECKPLCKKLWDTQDTEKFVCLHTSKNQLLMEGATAEEVASSSDEEEVASSSEDSTEKDKRASSIAASAIAPTVTAEDKAIEVATVGTVSGVASSMIGDLIRRRPSVLPGAPPAVALAATLPHTIFVDYEQYIRDLQYRGTLSRITTTYEDIRSVMGPFRSFGRRPDFKKKHRWNRHQRTSSGGLVTSEGILYDQGYRQDNEYVLCIRPPRYEPETPTEVRLNRLTAHQEGAPLRMAIDIVLYCRHSAAIQVRVFERTVQFRLLHHNNPTKPQPVQDIGRQRYDQITFVCLEPAFVITVDTPSIQQRDMLLDTLQPIREWKEYKELVAVGINDKAVWLWYPLAVHLLSTQGSLEDTPGAWTQLVLV
jgi:hypothetical protein